MGGVGLSVPPPGCHTALMTSHDLIGRARIVHAPGWGFPRSRLVTDQGVVLAELGRLSWFSVFLGTGQRVRVPGGARWRVRSVARSRWVLPVLQVEGGAAVARSVAGDGNYGISTRDHAYSLNPAEANRGRARRWLLVEHESDVAVIERRPFVVEAFQPVHVGVIVLAQVLANFGVLGERDLVPLHQTP